MALSFIQINLFQDEIQIQTKEMDTCKTELEEKTNTINEQRADSSNLI